MSVIWCLTAHPAQEGRPSATFSAGSHFGSEFSHDEDEGSAGELVMVAEECRSSVSSTFGTSAEVMVFAVVGFLCEF